MQRVDFDSDQEDSVIERKDIKAQQLLDQKQKDLNNANLLNMSNFESQVIQKHNPYTAVTISGPKWSKEGG